MKWTVPVIDEEIVDQDRQLHQYPHHLHLRQHHHHDQVILIDENVLQVHVIVIQDGNMIVNDDEIILIISVDDQDHDQEDGELNFNFSRNHSRSFYPFSPNTFITSFILFYETSIKIHFFDYISAIYSTLFDRQLKLIKKIST
jgi:hypothetical protein